MPEPSIHVARGGIEFGAFPLSECEELMASGFFLGTDDAWCHDMPEWQPLEQTVTRLKAANAGWRDKIVEGATLISRLVGRRAGRFVGQVKAQTGQGVDTLSQAKNLALEQYLPQLQRFLALQFRDKPATVIQAALRDETVLRNVFGGLHDCLPRPVRRFVPQTIFVNFCMDHRQRLFTNAVAASKPAEPPSAGAEQT